MQTLDELSLKNLQKEGQEIVREKARENAKRLLPDAIRILEEKAKNGQSLEISVFPDNKNELQASSLWIDPITQDNLTSLLQQRYPSYLVDNRLFKIVLEERNRFQAIEDAIPIIIAVSVGIFLGVLICAMTTYELVK